MKKFSVLLVAAAVAVSASAGVTFKANHALKSNKVINTEMTKFKTKDLKSKANFRAINEQPAGELKSYNRAGYGVYINGQYLSAGTQDGTRMDIVYGEDNKVYMKNILFNSANSLGDYWVEGTIEGNTITVPMGQSIYYSEQYQADIVLCWGSSVQGEEENTIAFERDERVEEVTYTIDGQTITMNGSEGSELGDGSVIDSYFGTGLSAYWTDDNSWSGFIEWNTVLTEREPVIAPEVITEIPEGCQIYTYYRNSGAIYSSWLTGISNSVTDGKFTVAFDTQNHEVYIQNPAWWHDGLNTWVKGTYTYDEDGVMLSIPTGQYLSWSDEYEYGIQLVWGSSYVYLDTDENGEEGYYMGTEIDERTTEINFMLGDDTIYLLGTEGDIKAEFPEWGNATGMMTIYSDDQSWTSIEIANRDENGQAMPYGQIVNLVPAQPANPTADDFLDSGAEDGYTKFYFTLPTTDVDGNMIDPEHISYSVYVDNGNGPELFTFDAATYSYDLSEDMTEIPYWIYNGGYDFRNYLCYFYRTNAEGFDPLFTKNIGIQAIYTVDGVANKSEIVWLYPTEPQVEGYQLVMLDMNGNPVVYDLTQGENGEYTTTVALNYDVFGGFDPMTEERPAVPFYFMVNGVRYGANADMTAAVLGMAMENPLAATDGCYTVPVGYNYNIGIAIGLQGEMYAYVAQAGFTGVNDINAGKTVANVRYYNVTGQEMAQPAGMTIQVTTYTDGTTSAVKVVK